MCVNSQPCVLIERPDLITLQFSERTPGSGVEGREASVVWRYCPPDAPDGDRQWARRQAAEAQNHIFDSLGERYGPCCP